jgi:hypothetical protein
MLFAGLVLHPLAALLMDAGGDDGSAHPRDTRTTQTFFTKLLPMRDTVYTAMPCYVEIRLDRQLLLRTWQDGRCDTHAVSTGTPGLKKGTVTPPGVYVLQSKATLQISKQFDNAKMFYWMQFSGNYGMHALAGRGYYWNLGKRPSSHGCVRLSLASAQDLYGSLSLGTPVMILRTPPARVVAFLPPQLRADTSSHAPAEVLAVYRQQLAALYDGNRLSTSFPVIPLRRKYIPQEGIPIGEASRIPAQQILPSYYTFAAAPQRGTRGMDDPPLPE